MFRIMHFAVLLFFILLLGCQHSSYVKSIFKYIKPSYGQVEIVNTSDTLHFLLNDTTYNDIKSMNLFLHNGNEYVSFFDQRSASLIIYSLFPTTLINRISIKTFLKDHSLYKTSVYVINYDSILITNRMTLYLFDSSGHKRFSTTLLNEPPDARAVLDNGNHPVIIKEKLYAGVRPSIYNERITTYQNWKALYDLDLKKDNVKLQYNLPEIYHLNLYGYQYLYSSFCYNNNNRFVFSFSADTSIYETDLNNYYFSYFGKSIYQNETIKWKSKTSDANEGYTNYLTHQAYGSIYFDKYNHRYLRVAKRKIREVDMKSKNITREQSLIIFDEDFRIIGESIVNNDIDLSELLITKNGKLYVRVNQRDEYSLHFIRLQYKDKKDVYNLTKN